VNNVWYRLSKDYVKPMIDEKPTLETLDPEQQTLENRTNSIRQKNTTLTPTQMMALTPDLMKAGPGQSGQYLDAQHRINMPDGDNFLGTNEYN
jgi:hypothetical protein